MFVGVVHRAGFDIMEWIFRIAAWGVQIGAVLFIAFLLAAVAQVAEEAIRKKKVKFAPRLLIVFLLICMLLAVLALNPPVICPDRYEDYLTPERREAVQAGGDGLYNWNIPLVPICIEVTGVNNFVKEGKMEYSVEYTVYYFCFGRMGMEYSTYDGFNVDDPIFRG